MGLTRTRFIQANTALAKIQDPITVLNSESSQANVDVGFLLNRDGGIKSNAAIYWSESGNEFVLALTSNAGITDSNITVSSYANLKVSNLYANIGGGNDQANVYLTGSLIPSSNVAYDLGTDTNRFRSLWVSGNTINIGRESISVAGDGTWSFSSGDMMITMGENVPFNSPSMITGNLTVTSNLTIQGTQFIANTTDVSFVDSQIELHTLPNLAPLTSDDGRDIGLKFHYYKTQDEHAFLGWANDTGYLEWYDSGREGVGNVFTGNTYGTVKTGGLILTNTTVSTSTTTGALRVSGGVGIQGNLHINNVGDVSANIGTIKTDLSTLDANVGIIKTDLINLDANVGTILDLTAAIDANIGTITTDLGNLEANVGSYQLYANANIGTIETDLSTLDANVGVVTIDLGTLDANVGSYQVFTNAYVGIIDSDLTSIEANVGAYQLYANANIGTIKTNLSTLDANVGAYQIWANANVSSLQNQITAANIRIETIDANIGSFQLYANATFGTTYSNANVAAYLTEENITSANIGSFQLYANANIGTIKTDLDTLDANIGSYQLYANANIGTIKTDLSTLDANVGTIKIDLTNIDANVGSYQLYANANIGTIKTDLSTLDANVGTIKTDLGTLDANVGSYQLYANANIGTIKTDLGTLDANVGSYQLYANANIGTITTNVTNLESNAASQQVQIDNLVSNANANVAAYLETYTGILGGTLSEALQPNITTLGGLTSFGASFGSTTAQGNLTVKGNLIVQGTTITIGSNNLTVTDSIIDLHTPEDLQPLTNDDGRDIGFRFHYYKGSDDHAFFGWENDNETLVYYQRSEEVNSNITGTFGNVHFGSLLLSNTEAAISTTSGALQVRGGVGIDGALYIQETGDVKANIGSIKTDLINLDANVGTILDLTASIDANIGTIKTDLGTLDANVGSYQLYANANIGTIKTDLGTLDANVGVIKTDLASLDANVGAYQTYANIDLAAIYANVGEYQLYANANIGTIKTDLASLDANVGVIKTDLTTLDANVGVIKIDLTTLDANVGVIKTDLTTLDANVGVIKTDLTTLDANVGAYQTFANTDLSTIQANIGSFQLYANAKIGTNTNSNLVVTATTPSTSNVTGALVVDGGVGIAGNVYVERVYTNKGLFWAANGFVISGGGGGGTPGGNVNEIQFNDNGTFSGANIIFDKTNGNVVITSATNSSSNVTGALVVEGGVGIKGNVTSGNTVVDGKLIVNEDTNAVPYVMGTGAFHVVGGMSIGKDFWVGGNIYVANVISQTSTILQVSEPLVYLFPNSAVYNYDIGAFSEIPVDGVPKYTGIVRSVLTGEWTFFSNINNKPTSGSVGVTSPEVVYDPLKVGNLLVANTTVSADTNSGALIVKGGAGVGGILNVGGNLVAASGVNASNYTTGALVVPGGGGVGITGDLWVQGPSTFGGNISAGNIQLSGNINVPVGGTFSNTGTFFGNAGGVGALYAGTGTYTPLPTTVLQMTGNVDTYAQVNFQNLNSGTGASTDFVLTADNGTDEDGYINLGINSSTFDNIDYPGSYPNDGYLIHHGIEPDQGNLVIMTHAVGTAIKFHVGAFGTANVRATVTNTGFRVNTSTVSTSTTSGALIVDGGAGIGGALYIANTGDVSANLGAFQTYANTKIGTNTNSNLVVVATTTSTSTTTGALVVAGGAGFSGNIFTSGWIIPSSNVSQNLGTTTSWWNLIYGRSVQAQYADLAENYTGDYDYAAGTVVVFGGAEEITTTNISHDSRAAGVVSTNPAYLMNAVQGNVSVALTGRVPTLVRGPIIKGSQVVTSDTPGVGQALDLSKYIPGCVIGKSLENILDDSIKLIEVVVGRL